MLISPPCCSMIFLQLAKPNPVPFCLVVKRGSNILDISSSEIPFPESINFKIATLSFSEISIEILPP